MEKGAGLGLILVGMALAGGPLAKVGAATEGSYGQPVFEVWDEADLTILILPHHAPLDRPLEGPTENAFVQATQKAIDDWSRAVDLYGPPWLADPA